MAKNDIILELKNVHKEYDGETVVDNFNFSIKKNEFVTFLGPSGCGKTTTLRMIAGFTNPTSGEILLNGKDITELPPYKRPLNTVFQRYALFQHLDVYDNIAFGLKLAKIPYTKTLKNGNKVTKYRHLTRDEIDKKVGKALKMVDLESFETRNVSTLSGGQQQRVAIARAIVNEPEILLLDEPLGALDLKMRKEMQIELKKMQRKLGITFIYVTHDQEEALTMSDRIIVMTDGEIQQIGTPIDIYNEPTNAFVADFIGESNIYVGTMIDKLKVRFLGHVWDCVDDFPINKKVDVVVRPEDIIINQDKGVQAKIVDKVFKGIHYQFTCMVGNNEVLVQTTIDHNVDEIVFLDVAPDLIQIMKREYDNNIYEDAYIDKNNNVVFAGATWECDVTKLVKGSKLDEDGYLLTLDGKKYDLNDIDVIAEVSMNHIDISDNLEEGNITGKIVQMVWIGDHYQLIIRTEDQDDFVLDTEWTWNEGDTVSVSIKKENIRLKLKEDLSKHEI